MVEEGLVQPRTGEVHIGVLAAGVSAFDLIYRRWGWLPGSPDLLFSLGEDIVGIVDKLGDGVKSLQPGQVVIGGTWSLGVGGGYTESICILADEVVLVPSEMDPAQAVCGGELSHCLPAHA